MNDTTETQQQQPRGGGIELIGEKLRSTREAQSMTVNEVADRLHLTVDIIENLEHSNYDALPEPIYVRGYLRSYLRLLKLSEDLLEAFDEVYDTPPPLLTESDGARRKTMCGGDGWVRCVSVGLVIVVAAAGSLWLWERSYEVQTLITGGTTDAGVSAPVVVDATPPTPAVDAASRIDSAVIGSDDTDAMIDDEQSAEFDDAPVAGFDAAEPEITAPGFADLEISAPAADDNVVEVGALEVDAAQADGAVQADGVDVERNLGPPATLLIEFADETWVRVDDEQGNLLRAGTFYSDERMQLEHVGALSIIVGRIHNVRMYYAGDEVDLSAYRPGVARLTLGAE